MALKVVMLPGIGNVTMSQTASSKRLRLSVMPNRKIRVSFPLHVSFKKASEFVLKHKSWITGQLDKQKVNAPEIHPEFPVKTKFHTVNIQPDGDKFSVKQKKFEINIFYPSILSFENDQVQQFAGKVFENIYRWEARHYLPSRLRELARLHDFSCNRVSIRNNRSNWGSCSSKDNISLNMKLMMLPYHLIDYVLLHELVHTRIRNHGPDFHEMLDELTLGKSGLLKAEMKKFRAGSNMFIPHTIPDPSDIRPQDGIC